MRFSDFTKVLSCASVHSKGTSLWVNSLKGFTTVLGRVEHTQITLESMWVCRCGHSCDGFDHGWRWANPVRAELGPHENHFLDFKPPLGWIQL